MTLAQFSKTYHPVLAMDYVHLCQWFCACWMLQSTGEFSVCMHN